MSHSKEQKIFRQIRDIEYRISDDAAQSCFDKCMLLKRDLSTLGYECRLMIGDFKWSQLDLPEYLMKNCKRDAERHVFLQVRLPEQAWQNLDPSADAKLKAIFKIEDWDGRGSTGLLMKVKRVRVYSPFSLPTRIAVAIKRVLQTDDPNTLFYHMVDEWFDEVRRQSAS